MNTIIGRARRSSSWLAYVGAVLALSGCVAPYTSGAAPTVEQAASAAGVKVCSSTPLKLLSPGATAGMSYLISADCADSTHNVRLVAETFGSQDARDRAIRTYLTTAPGRGPQKNGLLTVGNTVITPVGERDDAAFVLLDRRLRQLGAQ
jgi:hypothetical protein